MKDRLQVIAADSGAAILSQSFEPIQVVAACAVLVKPPYDKASSLIAEPIFVNAENGYRLVIHELELCKELLKTAKADVVHLDVSLGSARVEELTAIDLSQMRISGKARINLLKILPKIRKLALEVKRTYCAEVIAIGKESIPVRIAELTCGAHAIIYSAERVVEEGKTLRLGLPFTCRAKRMKSGVMLESLMPAEINLVGYANDENKILKKVQLNEISNPILRGYRLVEVSLKP